MKDSKKNISAQIVIEELEEAFSDCLDSETLNGCMRGSIITSLVDYLDNYPDRLTRETRTRVLNYLEKEYGLVL